MYEYYAEVLSIYDGDTVRMRVDLGMDTMTKKSLRLDGIDAPEIRGEEKPLGEEAKAWLDNWLTTHCTERDGKRLVRIETIKDRKEKYGRYLVVVWATDGTNRCLNDDLIEAGHAVAYDGGAR